MDGYVVEVSRNAWQRLRRTPGLGRLADVGMGPRAASRNTKNVGARIAGLKATESICPYCAVGCAQVARPCTCRELILPGLVWPEHRAEPLLTRALITTVREVDLVAVVDRSAASGR
jgi:hypothetical protein